MVTEASDGLTDPRLKGTLSIIRLKVKESTNGVINAVTRAPGKTIKCTVLDYSSGPTEGNIRVGTSKTAKKERGNSRGPMEDSSWGLGETENSMVKVDS